MVQVTFNSHQDYCTSLLTSLPAYTRPSFPSPQAHTALRIVLATLRLDHITPLLKAFQWPPGGTQDPLPRPLRLPAKTSDLISRFSPLCSLYFSNSGSLHSPDLGLCTECTSSWTFFPTDERICMAFSHFYSFMCCYLLHKTFHAVPTAACTLHPPHPTLLCQLLTQYGFYLLSLLFTICLSTNPYN